MGHPTKDSMSLAPHGSQIGRIGKAIVYATVNFVIAAAEVEPKYSMRRWIQTQQDMDYAMRSVKTFIVLALFWNCGTSFLAREEFGAEMMLWNFALNLVCMVWIISGYNTTLSRVAAAKGLKKQWF